MTVFDEATAITKLAEGRYEARPDRRFAFVAPGGSNRPAVNGGALLATVLRAVLDCSPLPHPVATSAHFLRVADFSPAYVQVTWLKTGRTAATARATLVQDDSVVIEATVTTGTVPAGRAAGDGADGDGDGAAGGTLGDLTWTGAPPVLPPPGECVNLGPLPGTGPDGTAGYQGQVLVLYDPASLGWREGQPSGLPEMRGYFGLREHRDPDALLLALAVDALPPTVLGLGATGWAPTVQLTMHMRQVPAPGLLRIAARCRHVSGGWFDEEAEAWDAAGNLVAQSRQIARVGRGAVRIADAAGHASGATARS